MKTNTVLNSDFYLAIEDWHVLVLHDGDEKDLRGIWGPYSNEALAQAALQELTNWPIDGQWSVVALKRFPTREPTNVQWNGLTHRDGVSRGFQIGSDNTQTNTYG